ncbi:hypothetical protein CDV31_008146 [Fusarium ambrosium]|uniref:VOC domain-containing protein n=1 Tax=Fusarium ambrosium TaxID=131363 RepID=A0A428U2H0_9HYPO|nr:hypothetical protein CDV31_008146 [Fusarium ambrosium]
MESVEPHRINLVRIAHVYYTHRNINAAQSFLQDFGFLKIDQGQNGTYYSGTGTEPFVYCATEGSEDSFGGAAFVVESMDDLQYAAQTLPDATPVHEMKGIPGGGYRVTFLDPVDRFPFHLVYGQKPVEEQTNSPAPIHKLGHFGMCVTDFSKAYEFYTSRFNFTPSDLVHDDNGRDITTFLHLGRGKELVDHHCFFFFEGPKSHVHHSSYETHDFDTQLLGHDWLRHKGYENCWGVGRHIMGSQIFDYWFDPSRFILEHYVDGDLVNEDNPTSHTKASPDSLHVWGPDLPAGFLLFYDMFVLPYHGEYTRSLFTTLDEKYHQVYKRPIASAYSMSTLVEFEPFVDNTTKLFMQRLDELADSGAGINFGTWLQMYAFDVVGEIVFGKKLGFLESSIDVDGIMADIRIKLAYASIVGQMPWLDKFLAKNPIVVWLVGTHPIVRFTVEQMTERLKGRADQKHGPRDFLDRSFEAQKKNPELVTDRVVRMWNIDNVFAGSDTTAISLRTIFYYVMRSPPVMAKLVAELDDAENRGELGEFVSWKAANNMPYLEAVIKESFRMHPAVGQLLERHVPKGGVSLDNHFLPEGTIIGMNPWVAARNQQVYGPDSNIFRPERWLEASPEQRRLMDRASLTFGHGARTCVGKNISLLEIYKLVPQLLRHYEVK